MRQAWNKGVIEYKKCKVCENQIRRWRIYCSKECMLIGRDSVANLGKWAKKGTKPWNKGKKGIYSEEYRSKLRKAKLKNPLCYWLNQIRPDMRGERHWNWKGGITPFDKAERIKFRKTMQATVFEKDNYTCRICGSHKNLQVDHIQPWADYVEQRFNLNNCRTLCAKCHYQITFGKPMPDTVQTWGHNFKYILRGGD